MIFLPHMEGVMAGLLLSQTSEGRLSETLSQTLQSQGVQSMLQSKQQQINKQVDECEYFLDLEFL